VKDSSNSSFVSSIRRRAGVAPCPRRLLPVFERTLPGVLVEHAHADWIYLSKVAFPCIVGLYEDEQRTPQALEVELAMGLDLEAAAGGDLSQSVHYVAALDQVQFIAEEGRWRLLESLAAAIAQHLLRAPAAEEGRMGLDRVKVRVGKPGYLKGRALPSVEIARERTWIAPEQPAPLAGATRLRPLQLTPKSGAYHVDFAAGSGFEVPDSTSAHLLGGRLTKPDGSELARGAVLRGGERIDCGPGGARLLLVGRPLF
jgi:7,8-dihydroneopterin aldolase/epimerase/oxygenase